MHIILSTKTLTGKKLKRNGGRGVASLNKILTEQEKSIPMRKEDRHKEIN